MTKLEELRKMVADMFEKATDKTTIQNSALVNQKIDEVQAEVDKLNQEQADLLKDYKDVVLHTSFKDKQNSDKEPVQGAFDDDDFMKDWLDTHNADGTAKK